ncbi:bifunctional glutamate--cysteine ligase GshA/glutathione synthetase GshB [Methanosphaera sp. WGK6]|uniref:bifunctional glutamate--cysteine ligase GshA/glutathione synthetase GshB n=1 Tax=Methanosphaera sp. WGK6 TaxID=1561964 RepID=UPI00084C2CCB|nr:bifunctional glutamate--cysteine ligase GshA/glutathione synthetase GshB [Methanosphaera sp. WGK6]OED30163.1 GshA [Methanosphaera sp. WGK6]
MQDYFTIDTIKKILRPEEILSGNFGLEKEGLRITSDGKLALTPHPEIFGKKLENPYITTDFSESQVEIVTPTFHSIDEAYHYLSFIVDIVNTNISDDEYIWNSSIPCIIPSSDKIPLAKYSDNIDGEKARTYRKNLAAKYGTKKQLISGIHYNFSFTEETIKKLHEKYPKNIDYKEFKNQLYLKIVRNYLRYKWLIIYLTGASVGAHETFTTECTTLMNKKDEKNSFYSTEGPSFRNASCGYKNLIQLYPRYDSLNNYISDVNSFIDKGLLSEAKELYTQIRLKPKDRDNVLKSLKQDGILYIEIRTVDINPFDKCGITKLDMKFIHLFIIYLLITKETKYEKWQEDSVINEELTAQLGYKTDTKLIKDGKEITIKEWATEILDNMKKMNNDLQLNSEDILNKIQEKIENPSKTYGKELAKIIKYNGFIDSQISIAKHNKETSFNIIDFDYIKNDEKLYEFYTKSLPNKKI